MADRMRILEIADEHWNWLEPIIKRIPLEKRDDGFLGYLFLTAMAHGAKHALESQRVEKNV